MKRKIKYPEFLLKVGSLLIFLSGIVSIIISIPIGAVYREVDPNGLFGHIGIVNGALALIIGCLLFWFSRFKYTTALKSILGGILITVVGHLGAIEGALLVGTAGLLLCYITGIWLIVSGIKRIVNRKHTIKNDE